MAEDLSADVRRLLKLSLELHSDVAVVSAEGGGSNKTSPHVPFIIESILFTRRFLPQYLLVLLGATLILSTCKCLIGRRNGKRAGGNCGLYAPTLSTASSSSSSTLCGAESPSLKSHDVSENTPLLSESQPEDHASVPGPYIMWNYVRCFLLRQPKPIPSLTAPRNTLPANETSLVILLFLALNLFYLFYRMPLKKEYIFPFADRAGLLFAVNLPVLYILAAKNNHLLGWITGWSYEGLNIFHRRLGEWLTIVAIVHVVGMVIGFYQLLAPFGYTLGWYSTRMIIIFGIIAFYAYLVIYFTSVGRFRQRFYELFLALHIVFQVIGLATLFLHHYQTQPYVGAAVVIWVLDRGVSRIACKSQSFVVTLEVAADEETVLVYCDVPIHRSKFPWAGIKSGWHAGQHVFLTVPSMGFKHRFQTHPFTIASPAPPQHLTNGSWPLQLTIRAQHGFSRELLQYAKHHQHTKALVEGPYSSDEVLKCLKRSDRVCLIAGGSGIAVTYPLAWQWAVASESYENIIHDRARYVDGRKMLKPNVVKSGALLDTPDFANFWIRQEACHESWVTMLPGIENESQSGSEAQSGIDLITRRFDTRSAVCGERPDIKTELDMWVRGDLKQKIDVQRRICVVVSGPDGLVGDVRNTIAVLVREGWNIEVHVEKFGW